MHLRVLFLWELRIQVNTNNCLAAQRCVCVPVALTHLHPHFTSLVSDTTYQNRGKKEISFLETLSPLRRFLMSAAADHSWISCQSAPTAVRPLMEFVSAHVPCANTQTVIDTEQQRFLYHLHTNNKPPSILLLCGPNSVI